MSSVQCCLRIVLTISVAVLFAGCDPDPEAGPEPSETSIILSPTAEPTPTNEPTAQQPSPTWTFVTKAEFCPKPGWSGTRTWLPLSMETTIPEEAAIATEVGMCTSDVGDRTYLVNYGDTAWSIKAESESRIEHFYFLDAPALLFPLRANGEALDVLGPHESALVAAAPTDVSWSIDLAMTTTTSTVGAMTDEYPDSPDFTLVQLKRWKAQATQKGSPNKVLAVCANAVYGVATKKWATDHDADAVLQNISAGLSTGSSTVGCAGAIVEYDETRRAQLGLEPRLSPRLQAGTFTVVGQRLSATERAVTFVGKGLKFVRP